MHIVQEESANKVVKCECLGMISYIQNVLKRCRKIVMDGADVTRGGEEIQEHERVADLSETLRHSSPFIKCWDSSALVREVSQRHFGTDTKKYVGTKDIVPNCLRSEVSWVRSVRTVHPFLSGTMFVGLW